MVSSSVLLFFCICRTCISLASEQATNEVNVGSCESSVGNRVLWIKQAAVRSSKKKKKKKRTLVAKRTRNKNNCHRNEHVQGFVFVACETDGRKKYKFSYYRKGEHNDTIYSFVLNENKFLCNINVCNINFYVI